MYYMVVSFLLYQAGLHISVEALNQKMVHIIIQTIIYGIERIQSVSLYKGELSGTSAELHQAIKIISV